MGARQISLAMRLAMFLCNFADPKKLGQVVNEALFSLREGHTERKPDVAFISAERWPFDLEGPQSNAWAVVPNLAVEVISPTNTYDEIRQKIEEYFLAGVEVVWVISTALKQIEVFDAARNYRLITINEVLNGEPVLSGFELPLQNLFSKRYE
jgi:Uma2 family endonuclease